MQPIRAQLVRCKSFEAVRLTPTTTPDGTSLEERINAWLAERTERQLLQATYDKSPGLFTALIFFTE